MINEYKISCYQRTIEELIDALSSYSSNKPKLAENEPVEWRTGVRLALYEKIFELYTLIDLNYKNQRNHE